MVRTEHGNVPAGSTRCCVFSRRQQDHHFGKSFVWPFPLHIALCDHTPHFGLTIIHGHPCVSMPVSFSWEHWQGKCHNPPFPHSLPTGSPPRPPVWDHTVTLSHTRGPGSCRACLAPFGSVQATLPAWTTQQILKEAPGCPSEQHFHVWNEHIPCAWHCCPCYSSLTAWCASASGHNCSDIKSKQNTKLCLQSDSNTKHLLYNIHWTT